RDGTTGDPQDKFTFGDTSEFGIVVNGNTNGTLVYQDNVIAKFDTTGGKLIIDFVNTGVSVTENLVQNIIESIKYSNTSLNPPGNIKLDYIFNDGLTNIDDSAVIQSITVNINPINTPPNNTLPLDQTFISKDPLVFSVDNHNAISIEDVDANGGNETITLEVTNGALNLATLLGLSSVTGDGTNKIIATGNIVDLNNALNGLQYTPVVNYAGTDHLKITTSDNGNAGQGGSLETINSLNINVIRYTVFPNIVDLSVNAANTYYSGAPAVVVNEGHNIIYDKQLDAYNPGIGNYSGAVLTVNRFGGGVNEDIFSFGSMSNLSVSNNNISYGNDVIADFTNSNGVLKINFISSSNVVPTQELCNEVIQAIHYRNTSNTPSNNVVLVYNFDNGMGADNSIVEFNVNVPIEYRAPTFANLAATDPNIYTENTVANPTTPITISNQVVVDSFILDLRNDYSGSSIAISRSGLPALQDQFSFSGMAGIGIGVSGTSQGTLQDNLSGNIIAEFNSNYGQLVINFVNNGTNVTKTIVNNILHAIQYGNSSSDPPALVNLTYSFNDGLSNINSVAATSATIVNVNQINNPPVNIVPADQSLSQNSSLQFSAANNNKISISDIDNLTGTETVTLAVSYGKLNFSNITNIAVLNNNSSQVTITGSIDHINSSLNSLTYTPRANYSGQDTLHVVTNDLGNTGIGGALTATNNILINVAALNISPTINNPNVIS
ncbi:MAG: beta strand repeat-containing protein, partial [Gammaproteobacteria bacterium]